MGSVARKPSAISRQLPKARWRWVVRVARESRGSKTRASKDSLAPGSPLLHAVVGVLRLRRAIRFAHGSVALRMTAWISAKNGGNTAVGELRPSPAVPNPNRLQFPFHESRGSFFCKDQSRALHRSEEHTSEL